MSDAQSDASPSRPASQAPAMLSQAPGPNPFPNGFLFWSVFVDGSGRSSRAIAFVGSHLASCYWVSMLLSSHNHVTSTKRTERTALALLTGMRFVDDDEPPPRATLGRALHALATFLHVRTAEASEQVSDIEQGFYDECPICQDPCVPTSARRSCLTGCCHRFHDTCLEKWRSHCNSSNENTFACPVCRQPLTANYAIDKSKSTRQTLPGYMISYYTDK